MPKVVDHTERRAEIVRAAGAVIIRVGLEATTVRLIAAEAGYSSGVLDHYFHGKDDILLQALYASHARIHERLRVLLAGRTGLDALRSMLLDLLPVDQQRVDETQLEMHFWARSLTDPLLAKAYEHESGVFRGAVLRYVRDAVTDGSLPSSLDPVAAAEQLHAFLDGLSVHAAVEPGRLPPERQTVLLDRELASLAGGPS